MHVSRFAKNHPCHLEGSEFKIFKNCRRFYSWISSLEVSVYMSSQWFVLLSWGIVVAHSPSHNALSFLLLNHHTKIKVVTWGQVLITCLMHTWWTAFFIHLIQPSPFNVFRMEKSSSGIWKIEASVQHNIAVHQTYLQHMLHLSECTSTTNSSHFSSCVISHIF